MTAVLIHQALADFNKGEEFFDHLAEEVVLEFPYGPTLGLPSRIDSKPAVRKHLSRVQASGLTLGTPVAEPLSGQRYLVEYTGTYRAAGGRISEVPLISIIACEGALITRIREYWDTHLLANLNTEAG